jgi:predicted site-specific integrase-resolvase
MVVADDLPRLAANLLETADILRVHPNTVKRLVKAGHLHPIPHTKRLVFSLAEIERYVSGGAA